MNNDAHFDVGWLVVMAVIVVIFVAAMVMSRW